MQEKNELNDIILNKSSKSNSTKKVLLTIATFAIILIVVVVVMNQFSGKKESSLPHAPEVSQVVVEEVVEEPEMESTNTEVQVIENDIAHTSELVEDDEPETVQAVNIPDGKNETERIYDAVFEEPEIIEEPDYTTKATAKSKPAVKAEPKQVLKPKKVVPSGKYDPKSKRVVKTVESAVESGAYYIQVGSFATYKPAKSFLDKITSRGYTYTFHKVTRSGKTLNKVLVGPFRTQSAAREALPVIKRNVISGAFLIKL